MKEALNLMSWHFKIENSSPAPWWILKTSGLVANPISIQTDGTSMGWLLSPVINDSHTEDSEFKALHFVFHMNLWLIGIFDLGILFPHLYCMHTDNTQSQHFSTTLGNPPTAWTPQPVRRPRWIRRSPFSVSRRRAGLRHQLRKMTHWLTSLHSHNVYYPKMTYIRWNML